MLDDVRSHKLLSQLLLTSPDRCLLNEGARDSSVRQAIAPARYEGMMIRGYDEGTLATNNNAAEGEGGYHNTINNAKIHTAVEAVARLSA